MLYHIPNGWQWCKANKQTNASNERRKQGNTIGHMFMAMEEKEGN